METFVFASALEKTLLQQMGSLVGNVSPVLQPLLRSLQNFQTEFIGYLTVAAEVNVNVEAYPQVDIAIFTGNDTVWQKQAVVLASTATTTNDLVALWAIYAALDKSAQFYRQAVLNTPHPLSRLFWGSLAEIKTMMRRRVDGLLRVMYNGIWEQIGFAPFALGRE